VLSADELGFQEVLDTLSRASRVAILTYNFAKSSGELVRRLQALEEDARLDIVSNVPGTFETYFGQNAIERARARIDEAKRVLDPKAFRARTSIRFNLNNHAKIVASDLCAYVGSANFSDESADNYELGFVTRAPEAISAIFEHFDLVAAESVLNPGVGAAGAAVEVQEVRSELRRARELVHQALFQEPDHHFGPEREVLQSHRGAAFGTAYDRRCLGAILDVT
jgi:phosphatidylserine/phosphatidylglycerophosphate/cardiolipin synthase-like enzyme